MGQFSRSVVGDIHKRFWTPALVARLHAEYRQSMGLSTDVHDAMWVHAFTPSSNLASFTNAP